MKKKPVTKQLHQQHLAQVIDRNIDTLLEMRQQLEQAKSIQDKIADWITSFSGSMVFLYFHVIWFAVWMLINTSLTSIPAFDPFPFGLLTMVVSLEAIFLSTFVLISQNRLAQVADQRADLDLHVNLLGEYEVTKILKLVDAIADHMGIDACNDPELEQLKVEISPDQVLQEMAKRKKKA
ncbi:MAG: hypothetical protein JWM56_551 [Candidatus Peribacteria bacterium]|nr:hypothetical protein [Candidatus Peribacteria bacterium]